MKIMSWLSALLLLTVSGAYAQVAPFQPNQVLTASALNNAFANAQITAGTINGATIGGSVRAPGNFTTLTATTPLSPLYGGTGVANNALSTLTLTGPYALGFTLSGPTSLTLPTSGTLLTNASGSIPLTNLNTQATNTVVGNATSGSASPTALAVGSCSTSGSALIWTTNTGFGCNTAVNASQLGGATFAAPGAIGGTTAGTGAFSTLSTSGLLSANLGATVSGGKLLVSTGAVANEVRLTQTTPPTCSTNCGTSPAVTGSDSAMFVTMGTSGSPASGWVVTFNGTWASAPACIVQSALSSMVVGKMAIAVVTSTTTITVTTNGTAPAISDKYQILCFGPA